MKAKPFSVRVSIAHHGQSSHRTYVRPETSHAPSCQAFCEYALGSMIALVMTGYTDSFNLGLGITGNRVDVTGGQIEGFAVDIIDESNDVESIDTRFRAAFGM